MNYTTEAAFRAALEARLLRMAGPGNDRQLVRFRKIVVFERLLARFVVAAPAQWMVKGGLALEFRYGERARTTVDLDLSTSQRAAEIADLLSDAARLDLGDYFRFVVDRAESLPIEDEVNVVRFRIQVMLDRRRFENIMVDVGSGFSPATVDTISITNLLDFAGFEPVVVPALPLEIHVAEKLHAYTRSYGEGRQNTRVKDLIDLVLIPSMSVFELGTLRSAVVRSFVERGIQPLPPRLPKPPGQWRIPYAQLAREVALPEVLDDGFAAAAAFLDPALDDSGEESRIWDPARWEWSVAAAR